MFERKISFVKGFKPYFHFFFTPRASKGMVVVDHGRFCKLKPWKSNDDWRHIFKMASKLKSFGFVGHIGRCYTLYRYRCLKSYGVGQAFFVFL